jgi:hypothetical protein
MTSTTQRPTSRIPEDDAGDRFIDELSLTPNSAQLGRGDQKVNCKKIVA